MCTSLLQLQPMFNFHPKSFFSSVWNFISNGKEFHTIGKAQLAKCCPASWNLTVLLGSAPCHCP